MYEGIFVIACFVHHAKPDRSAIYSARVAGIFFATEGIKSEAGLSDHRIPPGYL
jgi:hypothetical protein